MLINPIFPRGIKAGKSLPFYFILKVPPNAAAGEYNANIKIDIGNHSYEVPVTLTAWDFDIPLKHSIRTAYGEDYRILLGNTIENRDLSRFLCLKSGIEHLHYFIPR